ncbi:MAG: n-acetylglutamate synthase [Bacteroidota bacterium]
MNLHNKTFKALSNSDNGEVGDETRFYYRQEDDIIWATYHGGAIKFGTLSGWIKGQELFFHYQHQNQEGIFMTGKCSTQIQVKAGKIQLQERWEWTSGDQSSGTSILQEL